MKLEYFIARRLHFDNKNTRQVSRPAMRIATIGIAAGTAVILLAVAVVIGFKNEIQNKIIGFGSHIQITNYDRNASYETTPITITPTLLDTLNALPAVSHAQRFATKPAILKTDNEIQGVILKGIGPEYDTTFLASHLIEGTFPHYTDTATSTDIIISQTIANQLQLHVGDRLLTYFIADNIRVRRFNITAIYQTNIADYDKTFLIVDLQQIQQLNAWTPNQASGIELIATDYNQLHQAYEQTFLATANRFDDNGSTYYIQTIRDTNPQIFGWLDLLDINVWIILLLMLAVAGFDIISGLLIIIIEQTPTIGLLKALGQTSWSIRKTYLCQALFLITRGLLWGNIIALAIILTQHCTHIIPLDPTAYYVNHVPVTLTPWHWLAINIGITITSILILIIPSHIITRISPARTIRFE